MIKAELTQVQEKLKQKEKDMTVMFEHFSALRNEQVQFKRQLHLFQVEYDRTLFTYDNVMKKGQCYYI